MDEKDDDPSVGARFSVETLRNGPEKGLHSIPSTVHGAPTTAEVCPMFLLLSSGPRVVLSAHECPSPGDSYDGQFACYLSLSI